jgi:hypothetical protein
MVARSGVVFLASMVAILADPVEIYFGSFTVTSPVPVAMTSPVAARQVVVVLVTTTVFDPTMETRLPKPYDLIQGMERVINMMEDTLQICERSQCSTRTTPHYGTSPLRL